MVVTGMERIRQIWQQTAIPVIYRKAVTGQPLALRLPYQEGNRAWLRNGRRHNPHWVSSKKQWEIPKAWFNDTVGRLLQKWGKLYIIQPYREQEKCAPACWNAIGHECQCSCMGEHHGSGDPSGRWFIVSDAFATKWGDAELACRLLSIQK